MKIKNVIYSDSIAHSRNVANEDAFNSPFGGLRGLKKLTFISLLLSCSLSAFGRGSKSNSINRWSCGITVIPKRSSISPNYAYSKCDQCGKDINYYPILTVSVGVTSNYLITKHSSLNMALIYDNKGFYYPENTAYSLVISNCFFIGYGRVKNPVYYLDIPIEYQYKVSFNKKSTLTLSAGIAANIFLYNGGTKATKYRITRENCAIVYYDNTYLPVSSSFICKIKYNFGHFAIGPNFQMAMMPLTKKRNYIKNNGKEYTVDNDYQYKPYQIGIEFNYFFTKK